MSYRAGLLIALTITAALPGCSRDPSVRKQKYLESGQRYFNKGKYREAIILYGNAIQIDSRFTEAHYELAKTYVKLQQWPPAYQELNRVLELEPTNYQAELDLANLLIAAGDLKSADQHTQTLLQSQPDNAQVHLTDSSLLAAQQNYGGALEEAKKAIVLSGGEWQSYLNVAVIETKLEQLDEAEINYKRAAQLAPKALDPQLALGRYYLSRNRFAEAEKQFRYAIEIDPANPQRCTDLVQVYMAQGKRNEAEDFLRQAVRRFPQDSAGYRMLADFYFASGDVEKATAEYESLYREHPGDIALERNYIQLLIRQKRLGLARTLNDEILKNKPNDVDALIDRGQIQISDGDADHAVDSLRAAIEGDPRGGLDHYFLGVALDAKGDRAQALGEFQEAVRFQPNLTDAYRALAVEAVRRGDANGLEEAANHLVLLQGSVPDGYLYRAASFVNRKRFAQAEADIRTATNLSPQSPAPYIQLGHLRLAEKRFAQAASSYQRALDLAPTSIEALGGLMNVYVAQNQLDKAVATARTQIGKVPGSSSFYDLLGTVLFFRKRDLNDAQLAFEKATVLDKNNSDASLKLGEVQIARGSTDEAIATCLQSLKDHPGEPGFYILLGELYQSKRDWEGAKQMLQKALQIWPANPVASDNLAYVLLETGGNMDVALSLAQTARRGMLDSPNAADTLGWVYYQKGVFRSAIDLFQEALRLGERNRTPDNATFHYHLGLAYEKTGQTGLAKEQFQRVLKINPNSSDAIAVKKELAQLVASLPER